MNRILVATLLGAALLGAAGSASAQDWGNNGRPGYPAGAQGAPYNAPRPDGFHDGEGRGLHDGDGRGPDVCSGERAHHLEDRVNHEREDGDLNGWQAQRFHAQIDRLEHDQRSACASGNWSWVHKVSDGYDRVGWDIDRATHGGERH